MVKMLRFSEYNDIVARLAAWRNSRGITIKSQLQNFNTNYTQELLEFFVAMQQDDEDGAVDALCDMLIVCINADFDYDFDSGLSESMWRAESEPVVAHLTHALTEVEQACKGSTLRRSLVYLDYFLNKMGYDTYKCLSETIKEISSRKGEWSAEYGKWIKNVGAYDLAGALERIQDGELVQETDECWVISKGSSLFYVDKWYKADYSSCKKKWE